MEKPNKQTMDAAKRHPATAFLYAYEGSTFWYARDVSRMCSVCGKYPVAGGETENAALEALAGTPEHSHA